MKTPALVAVVAEAEEFAALFAAARERGVRIGWLDFSTGEDLPAPLAAARSAGVEKAVAVSRSGAVTWKSRRGEPNLRDLLREHFLGYAVVLVRGSDAASRLTPTAAGFRLEHADRARLLPAGELVVELLRPRYRA